MSHDDLLKRFLPVLAPDYGFTIQNILISPAVNELSSCHANFIMTCYCNLEIKHQVVSIETIIYFKPLTLPIHTASFSVSSLLLSFSPLYISTEGINSYHSILQRHGIPSGLYVRPSLDSDTKLPSRSCKSYLSKRESDGVIRRPGPSHSCNVNPIEMVWD